MSKKKYKNDSTEKAIEIIKAILTLCLVCFSYYIIQGFVGWIVDSVSGTMSLSGMIIVSAVVWLGLVLVSSLIRKKNIFEENRFILKKDKKQFWIIPVCSILAFFLGICMNYLVGVLVELLHVPESWVEANQENVSGLYNHGKPIVIFIAVYLFVPIVEEMVFRGKGYKALEESCGTAFAVILSSLLFAVAHGNILQGIYAFAAGLVFSFIIAKSGSLITGILAHAGFNISGPLLQATLSDVEKKYLAIGAVAVVIVTLVGIVAAGGISDNEEQDDNEDEFAEYKSLD